jgi:hypothetical protein
MSYLDDANLVVPTGRLDFGAWQSKDDPSGHQFHVGPHLMIVSPHEDEF